MAPNPPPGAAAHARRDRVGRAWFLPFAPPTLGEEEVRAVSDVLRSDQLTTGPRARRFEEVFAERVEAPAALALNSCTAGLHLALAVAGIGPGDAVVTTPMTFAATLAAIEHVGARPLLADVSPDTLNLDPERTAEVLERANGSGSRVRALLPVHYGGHPANLPRFEELAEADDLVLVEDAAHALGARIGARDVGRPSSRVPSFVSFSFYANKNVTTAEGGMLTGPPEQLARARILANHGLDRSAAEAAGRPWDYDVVAAGFKFNLTDVAAALGLHQLGRLDAFQARRHAIAARYVAALRTADWLELPTVRPGQRHAWHLFAIRLHTDALRIDRDRFIAELAARNVGASVHFRPAHLHSYYRKQYGYRPGAFPVAEAAFPRLVSLPIYPRMTDADVDDVISALCDVAARHRR